MQLSWIFLGLIHFSARYIYRVRECVCVCVSVRECDGVYVPNPKMYCAAAEVARFRQRRCPTNYPQRTERRSSVPVAVIVALPVVSFHSPHAPHAPTAAALSLREREWVSGRLQSMNFPFWRSRSSPSAGIFGANGKPNGFRNSNTEIWSQHIALRLRLPKRPLRLPPDILCWQRCARIVWIARKGMLCFFKIQDCLHFVFRIRNILSRNKSW